MAIMSERQRHPDLVKALYDRVFDARGSTFTYTVLRHYAEQGQIDPALITPVVRDIGEALVFKHVTDADQLPGDHELAAIVDQAILPAIGIPPRREQRSPTRLGLVTVVVEDQDRAIKFFVEALGFEVAEDSEAVTNDGHAKRWVVVRPPGAETGILLAEAADEDQRQVIGAQLAGRVGFFLHVNDFAAQYNRMAAAGVQFDEEPRTEPYGRVVVFTDIAGNKWDLLGPAT
jgi:catechol 2,3-dioxygenase-like lactoylglutathione lyase family enzyme